jgi:DNA-binding IclR family transcriptional regulator
MSGDLFQRYLETLGPIRLASGEPLSKKDLVARVKQARLRGYAVGIDERFAGVSSVAAPIRRAGRGVIAAVNVVGPSSRLPGEKLEQLALEVCRAAQEISEALDRL